MAQVASPNVRLTVTAPPQDNTVWISGNGIWADGAHPGAPTFNELIALRNSIDATAGGFAEIPSTRFADYLLTVAQANAIDPALRGDGTYTAPFTVWASGAFDGKSFFIGPAGGHHSWWANDMYRFRITDPIAITRMYNSAPMLSMAYGPGNYIDDPAAMAAATQLANVGRNRYGPMGKHHYNAYRWFPSIQRLLIGGANYSYTIPGGTGVLPIGIFDPNAPTPASAYTEITVNSLIVNNAAGFSAWSPHSFTQRPDGTILIEYSGFNVTQYGNAGYGAGGLVWNPVTNAVTRYNTEQTSGYPGPRFGDESMLEPSFMYNGYRYRTLWNNGAWKIYRDGGQSLNGRTWGLGVLMPLWMRAQTSQSQSGDAWGAFVPVQGKAVGWNGDGRVMVIDLTTGALQELWFTVNAPNRYSGVFNGTRERFAWVQQAQCFVMVGNHEENARVFRPPSAWGIS